jgi:hypothetical protein
MIAAGSRSYAFTIPFGYMAVWPGKAFYGSINIESSWKRRLRRDLIDSLSSEQ